MYSKALRCDMCGHTAITPDWPEHTLGEEYPGWIRLGINTPIMFSWFYDREASPRSTLNDTFDCCSIGCAQDAINTAIAAIPVDEDPTRE